MVNVAAFAKPLNTNLFMDTIQSKTVLFITGAFVSNSGWAEWQKYFESKGYTTYAPAWPCKDGTAAEQRNRHPDKALAALTLQQVVDFYANFAKKLPEKPIIIGHSLGGLITQLLVQQDLGTMAVAYHSVPPQGVLSFEFSFLKSLTPPLGIFKSIDSPYMMSFEHWQYTFTNGMSLKDQKAAYEANAVPESRRAIRGGLSSTARIDFKKPHAPLLFVSGSEDHIMPASLNKKNYKKYRQNGSITEYKEFAGRNHLAAAQPTWKEDADFILGWLDKIKSNNKEMATHN
jgi:pimeloyl-ACP methyl ester carboxylesterase